MKQSKNGVPQGRAGDNVSLFPLGAIRLFHNEAVANYKAFYVV